VGGAGLSGVKFNDIVYKAFRHILYTFFCLVKPATRDLPRPPEGLLNPLGLFYVVASALPSTLGANAGLLSLPDMVGKQSGSDDNAQVGPLRRSACLDCCGGRRQLAVCFRSRPRTHVVAMRHMKGAISTPHRLPCL